MNAFPSWIHRIPGMIETLALAGAERIDRQAAERWFDLRATAAQALLRRMGAEWCGHALVISGAVRMARLREAQEHPDWMGRGAPSSHSRPVGSHAAGASPPVRGPGHRSVAEKSGPNLRHGIAGDN